MAVGFFGVVGCGCGNTRVVITAIIMWAGQVGCMIRGVSEVMILLGFEDEILHSNKFLLCWFIFYDCIF